MIPVQMADVDRRRLEAVDQFGRRLGEIPPAAPVTGPQKPRVDQDRSAIAFDIHAGVANDREFHCNGTMPRRELRCLLVFQKVAD